MPVKTHEGAEAMPVKITEEARPASTVKEPLPESLAVAQSILGGKELKVAGDAKTVDKIIREVRILARGQVPGMRVGTKSAKGGGFHVFMTKDKYATA